MSSLDTYVATKKYDIEKINEYTKVNYKALNAIGKRCDNMMSNLLKGYLAAVYKEFVRYIKHQEYKYDNGENTEEDKVLE